MFILPLELPPQVVETVFDPVVGASGDHFGHFRPLASAGVVEVEYLGVFGGGPVGGFETGVEVIYVAFAALLPGPFGHGLCHEGPFHRHAHGLYHLEEECVFFLGPCLGTRFAFGSVVAGVVVVELCGYGYGE